MPRYEYKIVPAPEKGPKIRGLKGAPLFAHTLEEVMNALGADGWQYLRAETLPQEERKGFTGRTTSYRNLLIFQREIPDEVMQPLAPPLPAAAAEPPADAPPTTPGDEDVDNLWTAEAEPEDEDETGEPERPQSTLEKALFLQRKRKGVDL